MKKIWTAFFVGTSAAVIAIYLSGYEYIFRAVAINLKKGALTPSTDDEEKFPSLEVHHANPTSWEKHNLYNKHELSDCILKDLKKTRASSLIVISDHKIIHEQYWKDHSTSSLMNSFSMAKGILCILVGFAIDDGYLESEDQLISTLFPSYQNSRYGKFLRIRHLMTMQAGFDWEEEYHHPFAENSKQYFVDDLAKQAFNIDLKAMPGEHYEYQSVAAQILGLALREAIGKNLSSYLSEKLWKPLGMEHSAKWSTDEKGIEKSFCCIHASARDFAKIGQFIMQNGNWEGKQLLNKDFCKKLLTPTKENDAFCFNIWADKTSSIKHWSFYGFLGQFIIMIPEKKMVVVKTGLYNRLDVDEKKRPLQVKLLVDEISNIF
ncbi:6-aminohexanoate-dimer hydrolase [Chryseobacterium aquaeductus]|uniref:6-aminohexanoate-dimer hydrolase n=1 Tax=Chryseobacterium aquaeductus TaxID=2675056 RepID=A0A9N8MIH1_9FLAO|nr:serine hydrolase [Chryseobacterium aquaeductus]CAA7332424.1 6-aminohexanoate-dimer hydrolase [Chryseobacterium potabilaquae]CAD7816329.1 6-aminohexanoate-dimer hydrolase [Chryseobacterium aquaeductus]